MAENAMVRWLTALTHSGGLWNVAADVIISDGGSGSQIMVTASSATILPSGGWRALIQAAVEAAALDQFGVALDAVLFPDCLGLATDAAPGFVGPVTVAHPGRSLDSTFQPSATRPVLVSYSVRIDAVLGILAAVTGRVELRVDAASPPTTVQARLAGGASVAALTLSGTTEGALSYLVPPGHNVRLVTVSEVGSPVFTLESVTEVTL